MGRSAVRRWLAAHAACYSRLNPIYLGDDLFSNQPICQAVLAESGHFLFVCKPASHPLIQDYIAGVELPSHTLQVKRGRQRATHRFRWISQVPLRDGKDALPVNWFEIEIRNAAGEVTYRNSFITDLQPVGRRGAGIDAQHAQDHRADRCGRREAVRSEPQREWRVLEIARAARGNAPPSRERLKAAYGKLLQATGRIVGQAKRFSREIGDGVKRCAEIVKQTALEGHRQVLDVMVPRVQQVMRQAKARIFRGDTRSEGKIVSIFEPSTEVIRKGKASKPTEFGNSW